MIHKEEINTTEHQEKLEERLWMDTNLSRFDEILRLNFDKSVEDFSEVIIYHIAKLMNAVRASFFVVDYDKSMITISGTYGALISNIENRQFEIGEGPIGQAVKSKTALYFDDLPMQNSVVKTSLASINSTFLIIKPLKFNDVVYGVMELSILNKPERKYIDMLREVSKNIATMLQSIQSNQKTKILLEEAQYQAEIMRAQEEEMRQNMEELTTTQEEMQRKQKELEISNERMKRKEEILKKSFEKMRNQKEEIKQTFHKATQVEVEADLKIKTLNNTITQLSDELELIHEHLIHFTLDHQDEIQTANELCLNLFGYKINEIQTRKYTLWMDKTTHPVTENGIYRLLTQRQKPIRGQFGFMTKDKDPLTLQGVFALRVNPETKENHVTFFGIEIIQEK